MVRQRRLHKKNNPIMTFRVEAGEDTFPNAQIGGGISGSAAILRGHQSGKLPRRGRENH